MDAQLQAEIQRRHSLHVQQMAHLQPCLMASSVSSPPSIAGSPIHQSPSHGAAGPPSPAATLSQHLQRLHLQRQGSPVGFCPDPFTSEPLGPGGSPPLDTGGGTSPNASPPYSCGAVSPQAASGASPPPYTDAAGAHLRLQSLVSQQLARNSPPPVFPNLGMIREDATENGGLGGPLRVPAVLRPEIVVSPAAFEPFPACGGRNCFPPHISVTDERGKEVLTSSSSSATSPSSCSSTAYSEASLLPLDLAYSPVRWQATPLDEAPTAWGAAGAGGTLPPLHAACCGEAPLQKSPSGSLCLLLGRGVAPCASTGGDLLLDIRRRLDAHAPELPLVLQPSERGLALEHPAAGVQIELEVCDGPDECGLKMRRISGDSLQYSELCQRLVACMNM